jgi:ubiquitin-conjugating enzyme E2 variant
MGEATKAEDQSSLYAKKKQNAALLAAQYTVGKRVMEICSVLVFSTALLYCVFRVLTVIERHQWWIPIAAYLVTSIFADLYSGLIHWASDTWGTVDTPVFGKTFIRSFREHHVEPFQICKHDLIELNGDNCLIAGPLLAVLCLVRVPTGDAGLFLLCFLANLLVWVAITNQIHQWSHQAKPSRIIALLQDYSVILSRRVHNVHHATPFDRYYCITTGWLNPILGGIGFWKRLENHISSATGAMPRQDDAYWTAQDWQGPNAGEPSMGKE